VLRLEVSASHAGSRLPGWCGRVKWRKWLLPSLEGLNDDHAAAAAGTWWEPIGWFWRRDMIEKRVNHRGVVDIFSRITELP
jgi:hypothetical protein